MPEPLVKSSFIELLTKHYIEDIDSQLTDEEMQIELIFVFYLNYCIAYNII